MPSIQRSILSKTPHRKIVIPNWEAIKLVIISFTFMIKQNGNKTLAKPKQHISEFGKFNHIFLSQFSWVFDFCSV